MAGVSDPVFRKLCQEQGADLAFTEMVSAKGLSYANEKTRHLVDVLPDTDKVGVQLFGHEPLVMAEQARWVEEELGETLAYLDINMGCPARKIVKKGDGSALMKDACLASEIVSAVKGAVQHPVTVKFRRGWSEEDGESAPEFAKVMEASGADAITVHGRFAMQYYKGASCAGAIKRVKDAVSIPVIGNGDICSGDDALRMLEDTGCDALMVARAAEGNPWVFADIKAAIEGRPATAPPSLEQRVQMAKRHIDELLALRPRAAAYLRKHAMWYLHGAPHAAAARGRLATCSTAEQFHEVLDDVLIAAKEV
ncbi:MAG: tRNA dihydrouridine synthase DusB [Eggerthellaceae bacterium]|nr:tRNA dihydrouridine synthase DusB [Eggerthellaceae bacterium]